VPETNATDADSRAGAGTKTPATASPSYGAYYYNHDCGLPYERSEHWLNFFGTVADHIVRELRPQRVLDAGCAKGFLVEQLRNRGVEAYGVDISEYAISQVHDSVQEYCHVASLTEPIRERYDLITCVEVIEHMPAADGRVALDNLCQASDRILLSSSPYDYGEPTHLNVQPPEQWSALLANNDFLRELDYDASYLTPWATLYTHKPSSSPEIIRAYDRSWWRLKLEVQETRTQLLQLQARLEEINSRGGEVVDQGRIDELTGERDELRKEILRLRDLVVGRDAELATALGRVEELTAMLHRYGNLETRLNDVLESNSWRLAQAAGLPLRKLRERKG
jgi:SAM-dependent methyltransferase